MARVLDGSIVLHSRYRITELVAQGGMGAVYRADDLRLSGRECALKEIMCPEDGLTDPEDAREQFYREASTLARLDHPNLPKVSDHFSENDRDYLVMDFVPGPDLQTIVDKANAEGRRLSEKQVLEWAEQLCDALEYLHSQEPPVLHRDIKPANIRLTASGLVKLVDFGLVKLMAPDQTRTVTVVHGRGTASYTPLEQYGGETGHTDTRADIYGLGATLYHLLTGQPPLPAKDRFLRPDALPPPQELNPSLSERTDAAICWALAMHPDDRPSSIAQFRAALLGRGALPGSSDWRAALRSNALLLLLALLLLAAATYLTYWPPPRFTGMP
ncbi:MAG: serine/threonine protein kinase [Anaerolineae bacterium]|nr:serine/threonine protein kinase [Anaerolineae bacterium]